MSKNFNERFKGKFETVNRRGINSIIKNIRNPIKK